MRKVDEQLTGVENLVDLNDDEVELDKSEEEKYLGDVINKDGKKTKNMLARKAKGLGVIDQITSMLDNICFGPYQIEIAIVWRNALLLNSILTNCEAWYGVTLQDISHLEQVDEIFLRKILEAPSSSPTCMLYLETGCKPIRFLIKMRRLMFLQYILKEDPTSLISTFFHAQDANPSRNDWSLSCRKDIEELDIKMSYDDIREMSSESF